MAILLLVVIILGGGIAFAGWFISVQRQLVTLDENINNAESQIDVNLTSRFDSLTGLVDLVKGYNEHEYKTLTDTIAMRRIGHNSADIQENENILTHALGHIVATAEAYPELKSNENYKSLMNSLNDYENKVRTTRMVYNDSVTKLNRVIRMFPTSLIAPMCGVQARVYLDAPENKKEMPSMKHEMPKMS